MARWKKLKTETASERYDLGEATNDSVYLEDLFGDEPEHFHVHKGSVSVAGPLVLGNSDVDTVYVVDGDLRVDGPLIVAVADQAAPLLVTGKVVVKALSLATDAMLLVGGALEVAEVLITGLSDAGHLVVKGPTKAPVWLDHYGRGCIELGERPTARLGLDNLDNPNSAHHRHSVRTDREEDDVFGLDALPAIAAAELVRPDLLNERGLDLPAVNAALRAGERILT